MATRVELTTRDTRTDILNEVKQPRTYISPLSDASNKSSDSSMSSSIIIEDTARVPSKPVSMFNPGMRPRLSPKPFSKEKPLGNRRSMGMISTLSTDVKPHSDVPFQASTSISLSSSTKADESERVGRRIFTSSHQPNTEEVQGNKSEVFSPTVASRRQTSPSWALGTSSVNESTSTSQGDEWKVTSKPPLMSRKPELSQQEKFHANYSRITCSDSVEEQKQSSLVKAKNPSVKIETMDSSSVRAQLRPKRRPVSAVFLDSIIDPTNDNKVAEDLRTWNRRPLSEDLTSLFESRVFGNQKESPSEETKENTPLNKNALSNSSTEDQSDLGSKEGDFACSKTIGNDTRTDVSGISSIIMYSAHMEKETTKEVKSKEQEIADVAENEGVIKLSANSINQAPKSVPDYNDSPSSEVKNADENVIAPGTMKSRISLYLANTNPSVDTEEVPTNKEDTITTNTERKPRGLVSDKDMRSGRPQTTSQSQPMTTDFTKKFSTSPPNVELRSEKTSEEKSFYVSQDYGTQKEKKDWRTSELSEEKQLRPRRSIRRVDERLQVDDSANVPKERKNHTCKDQKYDTKTDMSEEKDKTSAQVEKTVKATMYDHNVEWHSAAKVYHAKDPISNQPPRQDVSSEHAGAKPESSSWSEWLSGDSVHSVPQHGKDLEVSDNNFSERSFGKFSSFTEVGSIHKDRLQKVDDNRRVEPRYEVIQAVGERVLSESIEMAPEDKAVTLRSQRSFHKKEREQDKFEMAESFTARPTSSLQRSRSAHIKRHTQDGLQESPTGNLFSRDLDLHFDRKNGFKAEKSEFVKAPTGSPNKIENTYLTNKNKSIGDIPVSDFQEKYRRLDNTAERENPLERDSLEHSPFGINKADSKGMKTSFSDFNRHTYKSISDSIKKDSEPRSKTVIDELTVSSSNVREETKNASQVQELKMQSYQLNRFPSDNIPSTRKVNKDESNDFISVMLNQEIEQIKKDLTTNQSTKESNSSPTEKQSKEESKEDLKWVRRKASFHDRDTSSDGTGKTSDLFKFEHDETRRKQIDLRLKSDYKDKVTISTVKDLYPVDTKATYFAVTCMDNKKEKNDSNFENQSISPSDFTSEEFYLNRNVKTSTKYSTSHRDYFTQEEKNTQDDLGTSSASKEFKTYRNQKVLEDDLIGKSEKSSERQSGIDIDALLKRRKQQPSLEDKGPPFSDSHVKPMQQTHETEPENTQERDHKGSPLKLDRVYKSKAVDIDSLMADYNSSQQKDKEKMFRDDDHSLPKWERSRSFRENVSRSSSSKWKDPPAKRFTTDAGYQYETVSSWYTSRETTSTKDNLKQDQPKSSTILDDMPSLAEARHEQNPDKGRDGQGIRARQEKSHNIVTLDSFLESSVRTRSNYKARSTQTLESPTTPDKSTPRTSAKQTLIEKSVYGDQEDNSVVKHGPQSSMKADRTYISADERQPLSEGRHPTKASDLISLMLENKGKRVEQQHARQRLSGELLQERRTHRSTSRQEWTNIESQNRSQDTRSQYHTDQALDIADIGQPLAQSLAKQYFEKEESKQHATKLRELEIVTDLYRKKSLNRQRERTVRSEEDHVKQCFSRSPTSNKDTDSIVQDPDRQYSTWSQDKPHAEDSFEHDSPSCDNISSRKHQSQSRLSSFSHTETDQHDSITEARDGSLDRSSMDLDSTDGTESTPSFNEAKAVDFAFVDQTSVLDSTALKNRVQLSRKSQRRAPSQSQRKSRLLQSSSQLAVIEDNDNPWMFMDSTEEKPEKTDDIEEDEKPQRSSIQSQRMPMFPGMDHSTLMAKLRKRQDASESSSESSAQPSKSPKSPLPQGTLGVKLLPTSTDIQDRGTGGSPQWLKELKSKKRQSQYENPS